MLTLIGSMAGALILRVSYGIDAEPKDDHYLEIIEQAVYSLTEVANTGAYLGTHFILPFLVWH